jgi:heptosyltransferase-2
MRILVRMPNWLGDAVMATPALNNLLQHYVDARAVLVGSRVVAELFREDARFEAVVTDGSKKQRFPRLAAFQLGRETKRQHGPFDLAIAFPNRLSSRLLLRGSGAERQLGRRYGVASLLLTDSIACSSAAHHAEIYNQIVNGFLGTHYETLPARLRAERTHSYARPTVGLNPGAAYGVARRWPPERFAAAACQLANSYDIAIFGGPDEMELAAQIERHLLAQGVTNYVNLAGAPLSEFVAQIAGLALMVTNDTGPMHVAGALGIPTVAVVGPTDPTQTSPWRHPRLRVIYKGLDCSPCHRRECPLGHHACMQTIEPGEVAAAARELLAEPPPVARCA